MSLTLAAGLAAAAGMGVGAWRLSRPPKLQSSGDLQLHTLAPGVHAYRGFFSNSAVLMPPGGVVVVDTQVGPRAGERLKGCIQALTSAPITHVVNTHYHGDHVGGNSAFAGAEILATEPTARFVHERDSERVEYAETFGLVFQSVSPVLAPTRTFRERLELRFGDETIELLQVAPVETPDACIVHWPERRTLVVGDAVSTMDFPWTGVPFLDEGLKPDGAWISVLERLRGFRARVLISGHAAPLVGERVIDARLQLLIRLFTELFGAVRPRVEKGMAPEQIVVEVEKELAHHARDPRLFPRVLCLRFAIYKAIHGLTPGRSGGWWNDLRPSIMPSVAPAALAEAESGGRTLHERLARCRPRTSDLAIALLQAHTRAHPEDSWALGELSDRLLERSLAHRPHVDGMELLKAATSNARKALESSPREPLALATLGTTEIWGAMVLAQPMQSGIQKLEDAWASGALSLRQRIRTAFFLGKAYQLELKDSQSDTWYRRALPSPLRPVYPLLRSRMRGLP